MDKNIYKFIFYLMFFVSFESNGQLMFIDDFEKGQFENWVKPAQWRLHLKSNNQTELARDPSSVNDICFSFIPAAQFGDIVFNELMVDPTPVVKLPNTEYIELKNTADFPVNLKNWILEMNGKQKVMPDKTIGSGNFLIISGTGGNALLSGYGTVLEVSGLTLANDGVILKLYSDSKALIDSFSYKPTMHRKGYADGGYSLERIDPMRKCGADLNWETSISDNGGTPGIENSVFRNNLDTIPPSVISVVVPSPVLLEIAISEIPDMLSITGKIFSYSPSLPVPDSIRFDRKLRKYSIHFPKGSIQNGVVYNLIINGLADECGNKSPDLHREFWYYLPKTGDLLINEVLFNPFPGGVDFVEIYNHSGRKIELSDLYLASRDKTLKINTQYQLSGRSAVLMDSQYAAFTSDSAVLLTDYYSSCPGCIFEMQKFPAYNLDEGWVVLLNKEMEIIDEFHYLENMHHPMISDVKGISLERNSFSKSSSDPSNWHSASKTVGFATPGYQNSATEIVSETSDMVTFEPKIFSPNDDGVNDRFLIKLSPAEPGMMVNIRIYNENGLEIKRLANNLMIGSQDIVEWDGTKENHQKAELGFYIINVELFGLQGRKKQFKTVCVLTDRLE
ncbi:MAG: lamin tail domain-containing protein [Bacteroidia bacterium]|nr:lamin tail domain-containing protein [Bacteroidia bacterium]